MKSGKIQKGASSSSEKKHFKKEAGAVYGPRRQNKPERRQAVNAVVIAKPAAAPRQPNHCHLAILPDKAGFSNMYLIGSIFEIKRVVWVNIYCLSRRAAHTKAQ